MEDRLNDTTIDILNDETKHTAAAETVREEEKRMNDNRKVKLDRKPSNYTVNKEILEKLILSIPEIGETLLKHKGKRITIKYKDPVKGKHYRIILSLHDYYR